ncbi:MAG: (2Fe-2S)-binding protein [Polyangiaceae bacterium]|nr:(2Fe-2S)-binding protein [Polyangiaceae bacterium]
MASFKIDGREIPFEPGDTVIRAAARAGIEIPHYCWHPGLSVAANCRMCLVELLPPPGRQALTLNVLRWDPEKREYVDEQKPKLVPACQQPVSEGMEIKNDTSPHVRRARSAVQELLLLNHPVDCPICDQAGECRLQDYWLEHQATAKRMHDEVIHKPKAVRFGPQIVYDAERCIVCTRCVRVSAELARDPVLSVSHRGNLDEIVVSPGRELDHPYSLMTEHVCPVGALTAQDFRFKARVWFLRSAQTICPGCATGCNAFLDYDPRTDTVYRHRPRENPTVNRHWMCDEGMLSYRRVGQDRILRGQIKGEEAVLGEVVRAAAKRLAKARERGALAGLLSAQHSQEDNYAVLALGRALGVRAWFVTGKADGAHDTILRHVDKNPNRAGVLALCPEATPVEGLALALEADEYIDLFALGGDLPDAALGRPFGRPKARIVLATHDGPLARRATVLLPAATWAEGQGTFVNAQGLAQVSERAVRPRGESLPAWRLVLLLASELGIELGWKKFGELGRALQGARGADPSAGTEPDTGVST